MKNKLFYSRYVKRLLDIFIGIVALCLFGIPMLIIALLILSLEGKPILFRQTRIGKYKKPFKIYKFRTMVDNADKIGKLYTSENDPRITKIGGFLRKTSLDELPQIFNVIKGDMSCIGYRPDVICNDSERELPKYELKPGITGYAQINGRSSLSLEEVIYWELKYVEDVSLLTDIKIIINTIILVLKRDNAN